MAYCDHRFYKVKRFESPEHGNELVLLRACKKCPKVLITSVVVDFGQRLAKVKTKPFSVTHAMTKLNADELIADTEEETCELSPNSVKPPL